MRVRRDHGEGTVNYLAVILLIGTVLAVIATFSIGDKIAASVRAGICEVSQGDDCRPAGGPPPGPNAASGQPTVSASPSPSQGPLPNGECAPEDLQCQIDKAEQEATQADNEAAGHEGQMDMGKLAKEFAVEASGLGDAKRCFGEGDLAGCGWTALSAIPVVGWFARGGKAAKAGKKFEQMKRAYDRYKELAAAARRRAADARERARQLRERLKKVNAACPIPGDNSFGPGTLVLLAGGKLKPIEDVDIGDLVLASDPRSGRTGPRRVTDLIVGQGDKTLVDITLRRAAPSGALLAGLNSARIGGGLATVTATDEHPFWAGARRGWVDAEDLSAGDRLTTSGGQRVQVLGVRAYRQVMRVYNLAVDDLNTYYVGVGGQSVLVHNTKPKLECQTPKQVDDKIEQSLKNPDKDARVEGEVADALRRNNCRPNQFQQEYPAAGGQSNGDVDVGVPGAIVEIYNGTTYDMGKKGHQAKKFRNHPLVNPDGTRQVIFYAPNVSTEDRARFQAQYKEHNIRVFASLDHMINHLRRTGAC